MTAIAGRVLLITGIFPPHIGGPATFIDQLAWALADRGNRVTVVCLSDVHQDPGDALRPFRVRRIYQGNPWASQLQVRIALVEEMAKHSVILVNGLEFQAYQAAALTRRRYVLKVVGDVLWEEARTTGGTTLDIDEFQRETQISPALRKPAERRHRVLTRARQIVTPSAYLRNMVIGWGVPPARVTVVENGVREEEFGSFEPRRRTADTLETIFIGRLTNWKGVETLLLAVTALEQVRVTVVGDGGELPLLVGLAKQLGVSERVEFTGRLPRTRVQEALLRSDVLVLTSLYEGLSHTLLEASAAGIPCIASDRGGNPETITSGVDGLLIPPQDVDALRTALARVQRDEDFRHGLGRAAKEIGKRFPFERTVQETVAVLLS